MSKNKAFAILLVTIILNFYTLNASFADDQIKQKTKYPDFSYEFAGKDKCENFNRKMFIFNSKLNKYVLRPVNVVWASVMPKYGMKRIENICDNIEYPKRLASCLIQRDLKSSGKETVRFVVNSTLGLAGMYDPAKKYLKIDEKQEDMEQALANSKVKSGPYLVLPILAPNSIRGYAGRALDQALNPSVYFLGPISMAIRGGLYANKTTTMQPLIKSIESTYADPYDVTKKLYGVQDYIKNSNLDRKEVLAEIMSTQDFSGAPDVTKQNVEKKEIDKKFVNPKLKADVELKDYNPQSPVIDSMRTAFFEAPEIDDSMWAELSVWNRSFIKKIKTSSINIDPTRQNYKFRYVLQKNKTAPVAIIYPSIGEGVMSHHSVVLAKLFYDEGYSVVLQGNTFHWEFVKSAPKDYRPGLPTNDAKYARLVTYKILNKLENERGCDFNEKLLIGTSYGGMTTLFVGAEEEKNPILNITNYISVNPPVDIIFALQQFDKNTQEWNNDQSDIKVRTGIAAGKIMQILQDISDNKEYDLEALPFTDKEAKLITSFIMQQKLSDVIFTIEDAPKSKKSNIYDIVNNTGYDDYGKKYLNFDKYKTYDQLASDTTLYAISDFLKNSTKYKIYHSMDDYFVNQSQLSWLKNQANSKCILFANGGHLGFLYRKEFMDEFKKDIKIKTIISNR